MLRASLPVKNVLIPNDASTPLVSLAKAISWSSELL